MDTHMVDNKRDIIKDLLFGAFAFFIYLISPIFITSGPFTFYDNLFDTLTLDAFPFLLQSFPSI